MTNSPTTTWKTAILGKVMQIQTAYRSPVMWSQVALDAAAKYKLAASFQTEALKLNNISSTLRSESVDIALDLHELRYAAMNQPPTAFLPSEMVQSTVDKLCAPLLWLLRTGMPVLARQELIGQVASGLANAPKELVHWGLSSALGAFGLPPWVLPVFGFGATGALAWWTYQTFLAPVGRGVRVARAAREAW